MPNHSPEHYPPTTPTEDVKGSDLAPIFEGLKARVKNFLRLSHLYNNKCTLSQADSNSKKADLLQRSQSARLPALVPPAGSRQQFRPSSSVRSSKLDTTRYSIKIKAVEGLGTI